MGVSVGWGLMFMTDSATMWKAEALLVIHGLAGVIWVPASQVLIHRIVNVEQLPSAVRLTATGRYLAFLVGPAVGAGLLLAFGPVYGIFVNALIYLPLFLWLIRAPYGTKGEGIQPQGVKGFTDIWSTMQVVARNPVLASMTVLVGASAFFVGNAYQAQMPGFALDLGHGRADFSYSVLLAADAAGGLMAGVILESRGLLPPRARTAFILAMIWCCRPDRLRALEYLPPLDRAIVRRRLRRIEFQFHGSIPGAAQCAQPDSRAGDRSVFDVRDGVAHLQRSEGRPAGFPHRHPEFAQLQRRRAAPAVWDHIRLAQPAPAAERLKEAS